MTQQLVLLQLISVLLWLLLARASVATLSMAKRRCKEKCGNITIPYPFGIGDSCYKEKWYEVTCSQSKPFLRTLDLEVLEITPGEMRINSPVFWSCNDSVLMNSAIINVSGSPFFFSSYENSFRGMGCDNYAFFTGPDGFERGCVSVCSVGSINNTIESGCHGTSCCQTPVPDELQFLNMTGRSIGIDAEKGKCKYAFLAEDEWFFNSTNNRFSDINWTHVPVVLEWTNTNCNSNSIQKWWSNYSRSYCECRNGYEGNPYLDEGCQAIACSPKDKYNCIRPKSSLLAISLGVGLSVGLLFLLLTSFLLYKVLKKRRIRKIKEKFFKRNGGMLLEQQISSKEGSVEKTKVFNAEELEKATDNYNENRILGQGGQGTVYKGMLHDGRIVAIKKAKLVDEGQVEQFINEVAILSQINHRNVVQLLGCCLETEVPLLVYEFISNGTLFYYIHNQTEDFPMSWDNCLRIITEVAGALAYLHSSVSMPIYHRDVKSTNILLDDKYRAKVSDFGTSRSVPVDKTHLTTLVQGTMGYLDPEYFQSSQFTDKSDVYSFGVVLVELLTREKPISLIGSQEKRNLVTYFIQSTKENRLFEILDAQIIEGRKEELEIVAGLAKRCLNLNGKKRPTMKEVAIELEGLRMSPAYSLNTENNHNEEEVIIETSRLWDTGSTSTSYANLENSGALALDDQPLLFNTR